MFIKRALISVSDKTGIVQFARELAKLKIEIYSTGNTAKLLRKYKIPVKEIQELTKFPEILDGRVKTLHPKIYAGLLALRDKKEHVRQVRKFGVKLFDLIVVNLYPFEKENSLEQIDIGGVSLLRAGAKNYQNVAVVCDPGDYKWFIDEIKTGSLSIDTKARLAFKAFYRISLYDEVIANYFSRISSGPEYLNLHYEKIASLRYGENPHQKAELYREIGSSTPNITNAKQLNGKELSFNNILDADCAIKLAAEFDRPTAVFIKHNNPCGVACAKTIEKAFELSYNCDTKSAFGGVVALNRECTEEIARYIIVNKIFLEVIVCPSFSKNALDILKVKPNLRLLETGSMPKQDSYDLKKILGGILIQTPNICKVTEAYLKFVTKKKPTKLEIRAMLFANKIVKHVMSNSVVFAKSQGDIDVVTGIGAGQMSRVDSVFIAHYKVGKSAKGSVMASDAFFPFPDAVLEAKKAGISAIIQPGGSIRDEEIIKTADKCKMSMVFTGIRMFRH